jgi:hypothetical protein
VIRAGLLLLAAELQRNARCNIRCCVCARQPLLIRAPGQATGKAGAILPARAVDGFYVQSAATMNLTQQILFSYTCQSGYMVRLQQGVAIPMFLTDPLWLTALATLVTSLNSLVWALRRKR